MTEVPWGSGQSFSLLGAKTQVRILMGLLELYRFSVSDRRSFVKPNLLIHHSRSSANGMAVYELWDGPSSEESSV
jgi:hypothetical protein